MSFAGGGSDLREYYKHRYGSVLSTVINKYVYITVNTKFTDHIRVSYSKTEFVDNIDDVEHNLIREALKRTGINQGIDIVYMTDMLPDHEGSGLGSSSSLIVGTLNALYAFQGQHVSAEVLAKQACEIEIDILKHPIGKQDQYAAAYGGFNFIKFNSDESVFVDPVIMKKETKEKLNKNLIMFYTGINCRSDTILNEQNKNTDNNIDNLNKMVTLSENLRDALQNNELLEYGKFMHQGWNLKKQLASNISNIVLDEYYDKARKAGAIGGKILGSGGGGFLLLYCEPKYQNNVRESLSNLKEATFKFEEQGSKIIYVSD
tara:strand:+ start:21017 stop:21970 length:954 start_codon:yes stop_codon:yes gene_type:complete